MLPYMLTVSRFAHYVKVIGRIKVGSLAQPEELERLLHDWVMDYVTPDREASASVKSRKPLREAADFRCPGTRETRCFPLHHAVCPTLRT